MKRVCAGCVREFGIESPAGTTHGFCKRHALAFYAQDLPADQLALLRDRPANDGWFCEDLRADPDGPMGLVWPRVMEAAA